MIIQGDALTELKKMDDESVDCVVTSPPYWGLRDYGAVGQVGLEKTPQEYTRKMVAVFSEIRRVLKSTGTLWLNLGDSYAGGGRGGDIGGKSTLQGGKKSQEEGKGLKTKVTGGLKPKDLVGIPWRVALALQDDGWYLRQDIIWQKTNPMPESVTDRCTKSHEYIFLLTKKPKYYFDHEAIKEVARCGHRGSEFHTGKTGKHQLGRSQKVRPSVPKGGFVSKGEPIKGQLAFRSVVEMRNKRSVWTVSTIPFKGAHFATFPPQLIVPCILAGCPDDGTVLDPFFGAGTVGVVAKRHGRKYIGIELNPEYVALARARIDNA